MTATRPEAMSPADFDFMIDDFGRTITLNRFTGDRTNISGDIPDDAYSSGEEITGILVKRQQAYVFSKEGFVEQGDAYLLLKYSDHSSNPPEQHDKVTLDNETFEIDSVINRLDLYYFCRLYKVN